MTRHYTRTSLAAIVFTLAIGGTVWANGEDFFVPAATGGPIDLVYAGQIRDKVTGRPIRAIASITISARNIGLEFPFEGDAPGHYRSPDIGAYIKQLSPNTTEVDPRDLDVMLMVPGYKVAMITKLPRKGSGLVPLNFELEPETQTGSASADAVAVSGAPEGSAPPSAPGQGPNRTALLVAFGSVLTIMVGGAARTLGRRRSTVG